MARRKSLTLTEVELEFMKVLWQERETTSDAVQRVLQEQGRPLTGGSVRKILSILVTKGYAVRRPRDRGRTFLYRPKEPVQQARKSMVLDLVNRVFDGSAPLMVAALFDARAVRRGDVEEIRKLIANRDREKKP